MLWILETTFRKVFDDPDYKASVLKAKGHWKYVQCGGVEECGKFKQAMLELGAKYTARVHLRISVGSPDRTTPSLSIWIAMDGRSVSPCGVSREIVSRVGNRLTNLTHHSVSKIRDCRIV